MHAETKAESWFGLPKAAAFLIGALSSWLSYPANSYRNRSVGWARLAANQDRQFVEFRRLNSGA